MFFNTVVELIDFITPKGTTEKNFLELSSQVIFSHTQGKKQHQSLYFGGVFVDISKEVLTMNTNEQLYLFVIVNV